MKQYVVSIVIAVLAASCTAPGTGRQEERLRVSDAENRILRKLAATNEAIDLAQFGVFRISALDEKWKKGQLQVLHRPEKTEMGLISCWAYAPLYSYVLANVRIEKNLLVADGNRASEKWPMQDAEAPAPPERIKVTFSAKQFEAMDKWDGYQIPMFKGSVVIEEKP